jgi:hypothetical protein
MTVALKRAAVMTALAIGFVSLSACAHQELMAPCTRDGFLGFGAAFAADCGPLLPVN